jgi:acyl carrier protein
VEPAEIVNGDGYAIVVDAIRLLAKDGDLPRELGTRALSPTDRIEDLGLDSVGKINLLLEIEQALGSKLSERRLAHVVTLRDLANVVESAARGERD